MNSKIDRSNRLPEAAIPVLKFIRDNGKLTQRSLIDGLKLPTRTVRYSIRRLLEKGLISKSANLTDMRSIYYYVPDIYNIEEVIAQEEKYLQESSKQSNLDAVSE